MAEPFAGMVDILFGYDTDIHFKNGDLQLTTGIDYIEREIYKLLITEPGDWKADPALGASPNKFIGEPNTREAASRLENYLENKLRLIVAPARLNARAIPVKDSKLIVIVEVTAEGSDITRIPFEFEYSSGFRKLVRMDEATTSIRSDKKYQSNDILNTRYPNKYWSRLRNV